MESRSSIASYELRTVGVEGSEATLVSREKGESSGLAPIPPAAVVKDTPEEDPFMVKLNQNDPDHPRVCVVRHFSMVGPNRLTLVGNTHSEPFECDEMVLVRVGWNLGICHDLCVVCPGGCYRAYFGEVQAF